MYRDMGYEDDSSLCKIISACEPYLAQAISQGSFRDWMALSQSRAIGSGAVIISPWLSHPYDLECPHHSECLLLLAVPPARCWEVLNAAYDRVVQG
jgi:hypothetical protein